MVDPSLHHGQTECAENLEKNRLALVQEIANAKTAQNDAERELREAIAAAEEAKRNAETALHAADKQYSKMSGHQVCICLPTHRLHRKHMHIYTRVYTWMPLHCGVCA